MNNKGFTLIEIIGVIAIIAILGIVTIPVITGVLSNNAEKMDESNKKLIISAAKSYAIKHTFEIKDNDCVKVETLLNEGFLEKTDNNDYNNYKVEITKSGSTYNYEIKASSSRTCK